MRKNTQRQRIDLIVGARPNFMKAFPVYEVLKDDFTIRTIHTGQHFDDKMSKVFFEDLKFPYPDIILSLDKITKAGDLDIKLYIDNKEYLRNKDKVITELTNYKGDLGQLGEIRDKLLVEFEKNKPDLVIIFGDVTSTLSAALSAKMLNIEIAHIESGLRSGDLRMPEEVNRILTDHISNYYFVTEQSGIDNLRNEGITENVYLVGNTMIDTQKKYLQQSLDTKYHEKLGLIKREYILVTLHRPSNVDDLNKLKEIFDDLTQLSKKRKIVYPIHPRTKTGLDSIGYLEKIKKNGNIILQEPLGYLEFTCLLTNCKYVITDSGGLQEESTALDVPCFTLRENTERPCTLIENNGTNQLINKISQIKLKECKGNMKLWDGNASKYIYIYLNKYNNIIYCIGNNLGDQLNIYLLNNLCTNIKFDYNYYKNNPFPDKEHVLFTGSLLGIANNYSNVFGAGIINTNSIINKVNKIHFVRGPLSRKKLLENGSEYVPEIYGDPGILLPLIYSPKNYRRNDKYLFIPHKIDIKDYKHMMSYITNCDLLEINVSYDKTENWLDILNKYEYIITSTLHGAILSLVYNKKVMIIKSKNKLVGDNVKFYDFLESMDIYNFQFEDIFETHIHKNELVVDKSKFIKLNQNKLCLNQYNILNVLPFNTSGLIHLLLEKIVNYKICIETFLLDFDNTNEKIDILFDNFKNYTYQSILNQTYKNYIWIIYVNNSNNYLKEKIKQLPSSDNIKIFYFESKELLSIENVNSIPTSKIFEGTHRGNFRIRNYLKKEIYKLYFSGEKYLISMAIDDDDYIKNFHFKDINFYANFYINNSIENNLHDNEINIYIKNYYIYYKDRKLLHNIIGTKMVHGNKFKIYCNRNSNNISSSYNIPEDPKKDKTKYYIIEKPKSSYIYMRYNKSKHLSRYNKEWLYQHLISENTNYNL